MLLFHSRKKILSKISWEDNILLTQNFKNIFENYFECFGEICRIVGKRGKIDEKIIDFDECFDTYDFELW